MSDIYRTFYLMDRRHYTNKLLKNTEKYAKRQGYSNFVHLQTDEVGQGGRPPEEKGGVKNCRP